MFAKTTVVGDRALPLFRRLAAASQPPSWNFTKYLLDRRGRLAQRFDPYLPADAPACGARSGGCWRAAGARGSRRPDPD
jgi:glutathione peroxidase